MNYYKRTACFLCLMGILILLAVSCSNDDNPVNSTTPDSPQGILGVPASLGADDCIDMLLMWVAPDRGSVDGYNAYRRIGSGAFEKINQELITVSSFGPPSQDCFLSALYFADTTYDTLSTQPHAYYVCCVLDGKESGPSDTVSCIPNTINRHETVDGMIPADGASNVSVTPTFNWDTKTGANSYLIIIMEIDDFCPQWIHRVTSTECSFKATSGITYLENANDELGTLGDYELIICAINDGNCGFALSEATFMTTHAEVVVSLVLGQLEAGGHSVDWGQADADGTQVVEGTYAWHLVAGSYEDYKKFEIDDNAVQGEPNVYKIGDIIEISFMIPEACLVKIEIVR